MTHHSAIAKLFVSGLAASSFALAGCSDSDTSDSSTPAAPAPTQTPAYHATWIRVIHASPDAPAVDIYVKGVTTPAISALKYGDTSKYLEVNEGSYQFEIRPAGASASDAPVATTDALALVRDKLYSAVAVGRIAPPSADQAFRVLSFEDTYSPAPQGKTRVRIVHASSDAPAVAIDVGNDGVAEIPSLDKFADASGVELPSNQQAQIGIWAGSPPSRVTAFTTPKLPEAENLYVIATGLVADHPRESSSFTLLAVGKAGSIGFVKQNPTVWALHASPDAPAVDIFAGQSELADDVAFGDLSHAIQVPPGVYDLDLFPHTDGSMRPSGAPASTLKTPSVEAGQRYLAIATGYLAPATGQKAFQLLAFEDGFALGDKEHSRVRLVHASPDAPTVDVGVLSMMKWAPIIAEGLAFSDSTSSDGLALQPGVVTAGIGPAGAASPIVSFDLMPKGGQRAFAIAAGSLQPSKDHAAFRLLVVDTSSPTWSAVQVQPNP